MATTTTNFGWDIPQSTDLVKDGATAIAALGQDIDTAFVDLKGGTTGQVLAKASNTDLDYSWTTPQVGDITAVTAGTGISGGGTGGDVTITNSMATAIDAKGDLIAGTGADAFSRLAVGNNGETLVADSSTSTGLRWQSPKMQQLFINSAMDIWQRGTTGAGYVSGGGFVADRWQGVRGAAASGMTMSRQAAQNSDLPNVQYCMRMQRDSGNTSTQDIRIFYSAETVDSIPFAGQTITFSYYVRKGANYSGGDVTGTIYSGTGTDQSLAITGFTGSTAVVTVTRTSATLTTSWTRVQGTATVGTTATQLGLLLSYTPTGTAGTNDWIEVTGFQLEVGSIATPFKRNGGNLGTELDLGERYYERLTATSTAGVYAVGFASSATTCDFFVKFSADKRTAISAIDFANINASDLVNTPPAVTNVTIVMSGVSGCWVRVSAASGFTQYRPYFLLNNNNTAGYIGFSAEL